MSNYYRDWSQVQLNARKNYRMSTV